ncbi:MAG: rhomboid family intramembrane serine protease [Spartobacteria bacterium]|nr:rhomboid family intramembrane serine protease [Spartobacteria bacterium]
MRCLGQYNDELAAQQLSDYLLSFDIACNIEQSNDRYDIWIIDEDDLETAEEKINDFISKRDFPETQRQVDEGRQRREHAKQRAQKLHKEAQVQQTKYALSHMTLVTYMLMGLCVGVYFLGDFLGMDRLMMSLLIGNPYHAPFSDILHGQVWRLVTPIFLHFGMIHILFNMLWMYDLGRMLESRMGSGWFLLLVLVIAVPSNCCQYVISGPMFGGMSGVVYGLLGYIWMRARMQPSSGYFLYSSTVTMMLIWLGIGFLSTIGLTPFGSMANIVHTVGLLVGVGLGALVSVRLR